MKSFENQLLLTSVWVFLIVVMVSCNGTVNDGSPSPNSVTYKFTFATNNEEWLHGFADYPPGRVSDNFYELTFL